MIIIDSSSGLDVSLTNCSFIHFLFGMVLSRDLPLKIFHLNVWREWLISIENRFFGGWGIGFWHATKFLSGRATIKEPVNGGGKGQGEFWRWRGRKIFFSKAFLWISIYKKISHNVLKNFEQREHVCKRTKTILVNHFTGMIYRG